MLPGQVIMKVNGEFGIVKHGEDLVITLLCPRSSLVSSPVVLTCVEAGLVAKAVASGGSAAVQIPSSAVSVHPVPVW